MAADGVGVILRRRGRSDQNGDGLLVGTSTTYLKDRGRRIGTMQYWEVQEFKIQEFFLNC